MFRPKPKKEVEMVKEVEEKKIEIAVSILPPKNWVRDTNQRIVEFLDYNDTRNLAQTCRFLYHDTKNALKLKKLAHYVVVEPNEDKVRAILSREPALINVVIKEVLDNSGRILIDNTIFQLAYGARDNEMCSEVMKPFFIEVYGSEEAAIREMEKQRAEKFAEDEKAEDKQAKDQLAALLTPVIAAITVEKFNLGRDADGKLILSPATLEAITTFREEFAKTQPKHIERGMHFRSDTLLEAYNAYVQATAQWGYDYNRCALFEDGILSRVLLLVPANDAQRFSHGLYSLQGNDQIFTRSLVSRVGKNNFYLTCRGRSLDFSLIGSSVDIYFANVTRLGGVIAAESVTIKSYIEQRRQTCRAYAICRATPDVSARNSLK